MRDCSSQAIPDTSVESGAEEPLGTMPTPPTAFVAVTQIFCLWCGRLVSSINIHETSMLIHVWAFKEGEISLLDQMPLASGRTGHQGEETAKPVRRLLHWVGGCLGLAVFKLSHKIQSLWSSLSTSTKLALCTLADGTVYFSRWYCVFTGTFCYQLASSLFATWRGGGGGVIWWHAVCSSSGIRPRSKLDSAILP